jgi:cycloeucalenol cycloisomerase
MELNPPAAQVAQDLSKPRWFSENPDKAWGEKFFLVYTPIWILQTAIGVVLGFGRTLGDAGLLVHACAIALPLVLVPPFIRRASQPGLRWHQTYWFKANLYMAIFVVLGSYFGSEYFFDVLGMVYNYPQIHLTFDATLVGSGQQTVPLIMYLLALAYFMTYHTTAVVVLRRLKTSRIRLLGWAFPLAVLAIGYFWAWMETFVMANPLMRDSFYYQDLNRMLAYGSIIYSCYFVTSFPVFYFLDEKPGARWSLLQTAAAALSASMLTIFMLDLVTRFVGRIY